MVLAIRADCLQSLAVVQAEQGERQAALHNLDHAARIESVRCGQNSAELAAVLEQLARVYMDHGLHARARQCLEQLISIQRTLHGAESAQYAAGLGQMGALLTDTGEFASARAHLDQAIEVATLACGEDSKEVAEQRHCLGLLQCEVGDLVAAALNLELAIAARGEGGACKLEDSSEACATLTCLGVVARESGDLVKAREYLEKAHECEVQVQQIFPEEGDFTHLAAVSLHNTAVLDRIDGDLEIAKTRQLKALVITEKLFGTDSQFCAEMFCELGVIACEEGLFEEAHAQLAKALWIFENVFEKGCHQASAVVHAMGVCFHAEGKNAEARTTLEQALDIRSRLYGPYSYRTAETLRELASVLVDLEESTLAASALARAMKIQEQTFEGTHGETVLAKTREVVARLPADKVDLTCSGEWEVVRGVDPCATTSMEGTAVAGMETKNQQNGIVHTPSSTRSDSDWEVVEVPGNVAI